MKNLIKYFMVFASLLAISTQGVAKNRSKDLGLEEFCKNISLYNPDLSSIDGTTENHLQLSEGTFFYRSYFKNLNRPLIILVPGLPAAVYYTSFFNTLAQMNYNVLLFEFPGKMNTEIKGKADKEKLSRLFEELAQNLNLQQFNQWHVVATSMGAILGTEIALNHQDVVDSLTLLSPVGLNTDWTLLEKLAQVPVVSKVGAAVTIKHQIKNNIKSALACPKEYKNLLDQQDRYLKLFNVRSKLSYLNLIANYTMHNYTDLYQKLNSTRIRVLITHGERESARWKDQTMQLQSFLANAKFVELKGVSHIPFLENPQMTTELVLKQFNNENLQSVPQF